MVTLTNNFNQTLQHLTVAKDLGLNEAKADKRIKISSQQKNQLSQRAFQGDMYITESENQLYNSLELDRKSNESLSNNKSTLNCDILSLNSKNVNEKSRNQPQNHYLMQQESQSSKNGKASDLRSVSSQKQLRQSLKSFSKSRNQTTTSSEVQRAQTLDSLVKNYIKNDVLRKSLSTQINVEGE